MKKIIETEFCPLPATPWNFNKEKFLAGDEKQARLYKDSKTPNRYKSLSYEEIKKEKPNYARVVPKGYCFIDFDNLYEFKRMKEIVIESKLKCLILETQHGGHFLFKTPDFYKKEMTRATNWFGYKFDTKAHTDTADAVQIMRVCSMERKEICSWDLKRVNLEELDIDELDVLPYWLWGKLKDTDLHKKGKSMVETSYSSLETALQKQELHDFEKLVGHEQSLREIVKQCKATIAYPPEGLPLLLYGATGTGKSYIAQLTYEWAKNNNIIKGRFVTVNCSEYANNPELLTANLFGHVKGAFTGADKDNAGLIALADQGVLFLDEVHELKSECQEKLFLFMDKGIYHRVGDNDKWYKSKVRLIFATTENPENVLLKTLLRRIPMTITIPSIGQRSVQEKIELIYKLFRDEEQRLQCKIKMSNKVYNTLLSSKLAGNIGELKSIIQSCCVNSLFDREGNNLLIHLSSLPSHILTKLYENPKTLQDTEEYVSVDDLQMFYSHDKEIIQLNDEIIQTYQTYRKERDIGKLVNTGKQIVQNYFDNLIFRKKETPQIEYYKRGVQRIFDMIESRYGIKLTNNDILAIACYLEELNLDYHDFRKWSLQHEEDCEDLNQLLESEFFRAANISLEICTYLKSYLEMEVYPIVVCLFIFYVYNLQSDQRLQQKACVVLAHGFSTASSIANAANHFLGEYIFDAIDMPLHVDTATMVEKLKIYLGRLEKIKELYLLVDMGSLEEIYKGLNLEKMSIGILNNASTPMALEIGNGVRMNIPMEELLKNTISNVKASLMYHIEKNQDKLPLILCSCASGYDTARKLKSTIEDSIPEQCHIEVQIYNYNELLSQGAKASVFEQELCSSPTWK